MTTSDRSAPPFRADAGDETGRTCGRSGTETTSSRRTALLASPWASAGCLVTAGFGLAAGGVWSLLGAGLGLAWAWSRFYGVHRRLDALADRESALRRDFQSHQKNAEARIAHFRLNNACNSSNCNVFNRQLSTSAARDLLRDLATPLGLEHNAYSLAHLAHAICLVEDRCVGRLATSVESMLVRVLATQGATSNGECRVLEIGVLFGVGLAALYEGCRWRVSRMRLTALDPLDGYYGQVVDPITALPVHEAVFRENMRRCGVGPEDFRLVKAASTQPAAREAASADGDVDVLILDGDHSLAGLRHDWEWYAPLVRPGGMIIFDDYDTADWPDVRAFVDAQVLPRPDMAMVYRGWRNAVFRKKPSPQAAAQ